MQSRAHYGAGKYNKLRTAAKQQQKEADIVQNPVIRL